MLSERLKTASKFGVAIITSIYTWTGVINWNHTISMGGYQVDGLPIPPADSNVVVFVQLS